MDQGIGRILQALRDCGADRNTIILFLSDNGGDGYERADRDTSGHPTRRNRHLLFARSRVGGAAQYAAAKFQGELV